MDGCTIHKIAVTFLPVHADFFYDEAFACQIRSIVGYIMEKASDIPQIRTRQ